MESDSGSGTMSASRKRRKRIPWNRAKRRRSHTLSLDYLCDPEDYIACDAEDNVITHDLVDSANTPPHIQQSSLSQVTQPSPIPPPAPKKGSRRKSQCRKKLEFLDNDYNEHQYSKEYCDEITDLLPKLVSILGAQNMLADFVTLLRLLVTGKMSVCDISFMLTLEKARFIGLSSSSAMFYWPQTVKFWKTVYRLLKGKAIRFFSGPKNQGASHSESEPGIYSPSEATLNFAVPSMQSLRNSSEDSLLPKEIRPGLIKEAIDLASRNGRPVVLSMDAKKVAMGLKGDKGDIDLWGYEPNGSFETKVAQLQEDLKTVEQAVETLNACDSDSEDISLLPADKKAHIVEHSKVLIMAITAQLKAVRHLILRQKQAMLKFEQLSLTEEGAQKYQYALSATKATIYQAKRFVQKALDLNRVLIFHASHATNGYHSGVQSPQSPVDISNQPNMIALKEPNELPPSCQLPHLIKQRTPKWYQLRREAPVTGSTLHNAIGLRSLKLQKQHYDVHVMGREATPFSPETQVRLQAGIEGEPHAAVTLAAGFMPLFFPGSILIEDGARFIHGNCGPMIEVSCDGYLKGDGEVSHSVEIKCPQPSAFHTPVQYEPPTWYVCQLLAEMASHNVERSLFVSYCHESTVIMEVFFDSELWAMVKDEVTKLYDVRDKQKPVRLSHVLPHIKEKLALFSKTHVTLLAEIPSLSSMNSGKACSEPGSPYLVAAPRPVNSSGSLRRLHEAVVSSTEILNEGFQLTRQKASEILAFVVSDINRIPNPEIPYHLPVAYAMKGYSLPLSIARKMYIDVVRALRDNNVNIACLSTDGQFHGIICRGLQDRPLTLGQLQRDVWKEASHHAKSDLLKDIKTLGAVVPDVPGADSMSLIVTDHSNPTGCVAVQSKGLVLSQVQTPVARSLWKTCPPKTQCQEENSVPVTVFSWNDRGTVAAMIEKLKQISPAKFCDLDFDQFKRLSNSSDELFKNFSVKEMDGIIQCLPVGNGATKPKKAWPKWKKCNYICNILGDGSQRNSTRKRVVSALKDMAFNVIKSVYPKKVLSAVKAQVIWPERLAQWKAQAPLPDGISVDEVSASTEWYAQIEKFEGQLLPACVDPSHLLTNMRVKVTRDGILGVDKNAFLRVADKYPDVLNRTLVTDFLDKQNVAFACRVFSPLVAEKMVENGDHSAAEFVSLMHNWYAAVDSPGIAAVERVKRLLALKGYLLHKHWSIDFSRFPPLGSHVKGIPFIWLDSMLQGIDTRIQLYAVLGTYSHRALGTLTVESFFGDLTDMDQTKLGCPKAVHIPHLMAVTTEINTYRHNPETR